MHARSLEIFERVDKRLADRFTTSARFHPKLYASCTQQFVEAHVVSPSPAVVDEYGSDARDRLFLLRLDGYVGFRCLASEAERLEAHLADTLSV